MASLSALVGSPWPRASRLWLSVLLGAAAAGVASGDRVGEVVVGDVRVQALSPTLVRIETKGQQGFEDRPTFMVRNRSFHAIPVTVRDGAEATTVHTEHYDVLLRRTCGDKRPFTDVDGPASSDGFPDGKLVPDADSCCQLCSSDPTCKAWVFAFDNTSQCYPLASFASTKFSKLRTFGLRPQQLSSTSGTCGDARQSTDASGPTRSSGFPDGKLVPDADSCCRLCNTDVTCKAWVYATDTSQCYPLASFESTRGGPKRVFGHRPQGANAGLCGLAHEDTDVENPTRSAGFAGGTKVPDADSCCQACSGDPTCKAWVYASDTAQCYPLSSFSSTLGGRSNRLFGWAPQKYGFQVRSPAGAVLYDSQVGQGTPPNLLRWPAPLSSQAYALVDSPRFHVPDWGVAPIPPHAQVDRVLLNTNGYDFGNLVDADTYVFLMGGDLDGWASSRAEFAALSGPVPLLPDYAYGTWFTWWHPYTQPEAEGDVDRWDQESLPLDVWGLDVNWRLTSDSQDRYYNHPNTGLFPDFDGWFEFLREKKLRTYFNDHAFPIGGMQTSPKEVQFRWDGLTSWMARGLTFWWFDLNWFFSIPPPQVDSSAFPPSWMGLGNAAWGSHVYYSIVKAFRSTLGDPGTDDSRAITLTKFGPPDARPGDGLRGSNRPGEVPGQHRYPVWWTGDGVDLQASVETMVTAGVHDFKPFVHSDCGGDVRGSDGSLLRWTAHCAFGTIFRYHGSDHRPWTYLPQTKDVVRSYLQSRYKLLPTIIAAGHEATANGFPLAARCDLFWPSQEGGDRNDQYIFLRDLLVAPISDTASDPGRRGLWIPPGEWQDVWSGEVVRGPRGLNVSQPLARQPMYYRRDGGIFVISQEEVTRTADQKWKSLTLDVLPSQTALTTRRAIYEKDSGAASDITLETDGKGLLQLQMDLALEATQRKWVVRIHLRPGQSVQSAKIDGSTLADVTLIEPSSHGASGVFPFPGAQGRPAPAAGSFAILQLQAGNQLRTLEVEVASLAGNEQAETAPLVDGEPVGMAYSISGVQAAGPYSPLRHSGSAHQPNIFP